MKPTNKLRKRMALGALAVAIGMTTAAGGATAQGFFSGILGGIGSDRPLSRMTVNLNVPYRTGSIIVSIGDRRLYKGPARRKGNLLSDRNSR